MNQDGFSLTELMIAICICGILLAMTSMGFNEWNVKSKIDTQFKNIYSDLLGVRSQALYQKRARTVRITSTVFSIYSSSVDTTNSTIKPIKSRTLKFPVTTNPGNLQLDFDHTGSAQTYVTGVAALDNYSSCICIQSKPSRAFYNSIVVSPARIQIGTMTGTGCSSAHITPQ